jgi:hypothetical protein
MSEIIKTEITDSYWKIKIGLICKEVLPYQYAVLNDNLAGIPQSHAIENFKIAAGISKGSYSGMLFQDSDVGKWIEAAAYSLKIESNSEIETEIDDLIEIIQQAQQPDGYLNTYYTCCKPGERFSNIAHGHELYCAGHLIEAAVAYYDATQKDKFLRIMRRYVDYLMKIIGPNEGQLHIYSGHPEIELALYKLFKTTGEKKYLQFMEYFINARGLQPSFLETDSGFGEQYKDKWFHLSYHQAHKPVRDQNEAVGHVVRAMYLYSAMADLAKENGDNSLYSTLKHLWSNVTRKKMYITGAIGSEAHGEAFSVDYDLPNDRAYAETCASIGLIFWAKRMIEIEQKGEYADIMELALYNGVSSGISHDGKHYFYVNPLMMLPSEVNARYDLRHVKSERVTWFGCACCPPNIARLFTSLDKYIYEFDAEKNKLFVLLYLRNNMSFSSEKINFSLQSETDYPDNGKIKYTYSGDNSNLSICLRIPQWCEEYSIMINGKEIQTCLTDGFIEINKEWENGDTIELVMDLDSNYVFANPKVWANSGRVSIMRGPIIYCFEEIDNGANLGGMVVDTHSEIEIIHDPKTYGEHVVLGLSGFTEDDDFWTNKLYSFSNGRRIPKKFVAVPIEVGEIEDWEK